MGTRFQPSKKPIHPYGVIVRADSPSESEGLHFALRRIAQLQEEVRTLREALLRADHTLAQRQILLRNGLRRELELRVQLVKGMF